MAAFTAAIVLASCGDHADAAGGRDEEIGGAARPERASDGRVVIVTLDGVRWQDVFVGPDPSLGDVKMAPARALMPRLHTLVAAHGVAIGAALPRCETTVKTAGGANVSMPGYLEIFTGRPTRCLDNRCPHVGSTVLDEAAGAEGTVAASIGSWEALSNVVASAGTEAFVSSGRAWPPKLVADDSTLSKLTAMGSAVDPYPGAGEYRPDTETAAIALEYLRTVRPALLHVGLGDTDEQAHRGDYPAYLEALYRADAFIGAVADTLGEMGAIGKRTTVIVTTDHGRSANFRDHSATSTEAGHTFVAAFGASVSRLGIVCPSRNVTHVDIAPTIRQLLGLPGDVRPDAGTPIPEIVSGMLEGRGFEGFEALGEGLAAGQVGLAIGL